MYFAQLPNATYCISPLEKDGKTHDDQTDEVNSLNEIFRGQTFMTYRNAVLPAMLSHPVQSHPDSLVRIADEA